MKILVTGATGFIGRELCRQLHRAGHSLAILTRKAPPTGAALPVPCEVYQWSDFTQPPGADVFNDVDGVVHLMGESLDARRWNAKQKQVLRDSRILSGMNLVASAKRANVRLKFWIGGSAIGIYGDRGDEHLTEQSPLAQDFLGQLCQEWEGTADLAQDLLGCRAIKLRTGLVLGAGGLVAKLKPIFRLGLGGRLGSGEQWMSWIHVEDLVRMIHWAIEDANLSGPINGVSLNPVTNRDFTEKFAEALKVRVGPPVPRFALELVQGEFASAILASQRVAPEVAIKSGFRFQFPALPSALRTVLSTVNG